VIPENHLFLLQAVQTLRDRGRRQPDPSAKLGEAQPRVRLKLRE
jgi:hypothetical protein